VAESTDQGVRLASRAAVPMRPSGPGLLGTAILSGVFGLMVAGSVVLALVWWRGDTGRPAAMGEGHGLNLPEGEQSPTQTEPERGLASQSGPAAFESAESRF